MCPATVAETMMGAMISVAQEKAAAGNYAEAVQAITTFIEAVEDGDDKVRRAFGANLVPLYCLRAKAHYEASLKGDEPTGLEQARDDVRRAEESLDRFYEGVDAAERESIRTAIGNVISADEPVRNDAIAAVLKLRSTAPATAGEAPQQSGAGRAQRAESGAKVWPHVIFFLVGLVLWGITAGLFSIAISVNLASGIKIVFAVLATVLFFVLFDLGCVRGWDWLSDRYSMGIYAWGIKVVVFMLLPVTLIGAIPVLYWTGKGAMRWYYQRFG